MKFISKLLLLLSPLAVLSCGDDNGGGASPEAASLQLSVPASGAKDVATSTKTIDLTFSQEVNFVSGKEADFSGTKCGMTAFSKSQNVMTFTIPVTLKRGQTYTLSVPDGFFKTKQGGADIPAFSVTFSTPDAPTPGSVADRSRISRPLCLAHSNASKRRRCRPHSTTAGVPRCRHNSLSSHP